MGPRALEVRWVPPACRMGSCTGATPGQTRSSGLTWRRERTARWFCPATTWTCSLCLCLRISSTGVTGEGFRPSLLLRSVPSFLAPAEFLLTAPPFPPGLTPMAPSNAGAKTMPLTLCPCGRASASSSKTSRSSTGTGRKVRPGMEGEVRGALACECAPQRTQSERGWERNKTQRGTFQRPQGPKGGEQELRSPRTDLVLTVGAWRVV